VYFILNLLKKWDLENMQFSLRNYIDQKTNKKFYQKPLFYFAAAIIMFILAFFLHKYDVEYKNWLQLHSYIDPKGSRLSSLFDLIKPYGNGLTAVFIATVIGGLKYRRIAFKIALSLIVMAVIVGVLKPTIHRERPNGKNFYSFPSGDAATATALFVTIAAEAPIMAPAVAIVPAVAFLRNFDNWHWLSDVLAGIGFGLIAVGISMMFDLRRHRLVKLIKPKHLALLSVLLAIIFYIPQAVKGGGLFFDFGEFYMPFLFIWLASQYIFKHKKTALKRYFPDYHKLKRNFNLSEKNRIILFVNALLYIIFSIISTFFAIISYLLNFIFVIKASSTSPKANNKLLPIIDVLLSIVAILMFVIAWLYWCGWLRFTLSGLAIFIISYLTIKINAKRHGKLSSVSQFAVTSILLFILFAVIIFLPSLYRFFNTAY